MKPHTHAKLGLLRGHNSHLLFCFKVILKYNCQNLTNSLSVLHWPTQEAFEPLKSIRALCIFKILVSVVIQQSNLSVLGSISEAELVYKGCEMIALILFMAGLDCQLAAEQLLIRHSCVLLDLNNSLLIKLTENRTKHKELLCLLAFPVSSHYTAFCSLLAPCVDKQSMPSLKRIPYPLAELWSLELASAVRLSSLLFLQGLTRIHKQIGKCFVQNEVIHGSLPHGHSKHTLLQNKS